MKNLILSFFALLCISSYGQVTNEGKPASWDARLSDDLESIQMPSFDMRKVQEEDAINDKKPDEPFKFGHKFDVNYNFKNSGQWTELANGDRIWRVRFNSEGAQTLNFILTDFYLPKGAKIYLYNDDKSDLLGAYDHQSNNADKVLGTWFVRGDDIYLEYYEPKTVKDQGTFTISHITHGYRSLKNAVGNSNINSSGNCNHDVNCPINFDLDQYKDVNKRAVAVIIRNGNSFCTGCLINNTANDGKPYFLTANHCYSDPATWAFRFNWISEVAVCASTNLSQSNSEFNSFNFMSVSGATLRARRYESDFCLVEINSPIPTSWNRVWAGWSRSTTAPTRVFGIHHPAGDIMKTCRDSAPTTRNVSVTFEGSPTTERVWRVSDWELGVTEGGSSGSPLFDTNGRIIGQLWRGSAACSGTNDNGGYDEYGRFANSWNDGSSSNARLRDWLDPTNSNPTTLNLYPTQTCNMPSQNVTTNVTRTSATQTWSSLVATPASGYEYAISTSSTPPSSGTITTATTINNSGLTPGTKYFFHVRSRCSTSNFSLWLTTEFVTLCNAITTLPFNEGFESNSPTVDCWKNEFVLGRTNWMTRTGSLSPSSTVTNLITTAQSGTQNARFVARGTNGVANSPTTKLYSQELDLTEYENVTLNFWYGQQQGTSSTNQNYTRVFYRTSASSSWQQIVQYTGNVNSWTNVTLNLPNPSASYQIAFEGHFRSGCANVIDNVTINGTLKPRIATTSCNSNLNLFHYDLIYAEPYVGATNYRFRIGTSTFDSTSGSATLANILGNNVNFNTTYDVSVAVFVDGSWSNYGNSCSISTTSAPVSEIQNYTCGSTIPTLGSNIYFKNGYNVEIYEYRLTRSSDNFVLGTHQTTNRFVKLSNFDGVGSAVQYNLQVRLRHNNVWGNWSATCHIFSPNNLTTLLRPAYCNQTLANNLSPIYARGVVGATDYEFRVTNTSTNQTGTVERTTTAFHLGQVTGITVNAGTIYNIDVRVKINNIWGPYGTICSVTTPTPPSLLNNVDITNLVDQVIVYPNPSEEHFTIKLPLNDLAIVQLFDINGKEIERKEINDKFEISVGHNLNAGVYLIKVEQNGENYAFKVIKK